MTQNLPSVVDLQRRPSPTPTPQALTWHRGALWMGSRDLRQFYGINVDTWSVFEESEPPGIPWAAVSTGESLAVTTGEGANDDRYVRDYRPGAKSWGERRFACPDFTGSYLSYDGGHLYLSQWYKHRILKMARDGEILREIEIGDEICGHVFVDGSLYVLRGTEQDGEHWRIAQLDPREEKPQVEDIATVPFASRSLAHDGRQFWSNHRAGNETISFNLPA